ncbi:MAG: hypothetical protein WCG84_03320, partial [Candidatus Moraniibacteriota bacterium]
MPRNCRDKEGDEEIKKDFSTQFLSGGLEMKTFFSTFFLRYYHCGGETTKRRLAMKAMAKVFLLLFLFVFSFGQFAEANMNKSMGVPQGSYQQHKTKNQTHSHKYHMRKHYSNHHKYHKHHHWHLKSNRPLLKRHHTVAAASSQNETAFTPYTNVGGDPLVSLNKHKGSWEKLTAQEEKAISEMACLSKKGCLNASEWANLREEVAHSKEDKRVTVEFLPQGYKFAFVSSGHKMLKNKEWQGKDKLPVFVYHLESGRELPRIYKCGNWALPNVAMKPPVEVVVPVTPATVKMPEQVVSQPTFVEDKECRYQPTNFVAGTVSVTPGASAAGLTGYWNVAQHCMRRISKTEEFGFGVQAVVEANAWWGKSVEGRRGEYQTYRPRIFPLSVRYRKIDGNTMYDFLGGAGVGGLITTGGEDSAHFDKMLRAYLTGSLTTNLGVWRKGESGWAKDWDFTASVDVPFAQLAKEGQWNGQQLASNKIGSIYASASLDVQYRIASDCKPDAPLGGGHLYLRGGIFVNAPELYAAHAGLLGTDCDYIKQLWAGPSANLVTGQFSILGGAGLNLIGYMDYINAMGKSKEVSAKIAARKLHDGR